MMVNTFQSNKNPVLQQLTDAFASTFLNWDGDESSCKMCGQPVDFEVMTTADLKEYKVSGICKKCQDKLYS